MLSRVTEKPLVWLHGEVKTPPFSQAARIEAGFLLRRLQNGEILNLPASRPLPVLGSNCHELRIVDGDVGWRIVYHVASDAIVILEVFSKKTRTLPKHVIDASRKRLRRYLGLARETYAN
jgi:phage-related protein